MCYPLLQLRGLTLTTTSAHADIHSRFFDLSTPLSEGRSYPNSTSRCQRSHLNIVSYGQTPRIIHVEPQRVLSTIKAWCTERRPKERVWRYGGRERKDSETLEKVVQRARSEALKDDIYYIETNGFSPDIWSKRSVRGLLSLVAWKNTAGSSKSWRRCAKIKPSEPQSHARAAIKAGNHDSRLFKSSVWLPQTFVRAQWKGRSDHRDRPRKMLRFQKPRLKWSYHPLIDGWENFDHRTPLPEDSQVQQDFDQTPYRNVSNASPQAGYIWRYDESLPKDLLMLSRWRVGLFLRHESLVDVYAILDVSVHRQFDVKLELHIFRQHDFRNSETYIRRKVWRMKESELCVDCFWYGDRDAFVMRVPEDVGRFQLQNTRREFPYLVNRRGSSVKRMSRPETKAGEKLTYAAVLRKAVEIDLQSPPLQAEQMQEKQAQQMELMDARMRERKRQKQKEKRQTRRRAKRAEDVSIVS